MNPRLSLVARHLTRPRPTHARTAAAVQLRKSFPVAAMASASTADERNSRAIHTAACLIIGDEVLGGKAGSQMEQAL